jgi:hypothetical protein
VPPPHFPRGYFDPLMPVTRQLLDNGLSLVQTAEWLVQEGALETRHRERYCRAMRNRFSRLRQKRRAAAGEILQWRAALGFDSVHATGRDGTALCGLRTAAWLDAAGTATRCTRCLGVAARTGATVEG